MNRMQEEGNRYYSKYVGIVQISDPTEVTTRLATQLAGPYVKGLVWCSCPELGFEGDNLIPCRYGLSIPFYKVKDQDKLWIEPTIGQTERWIYSGFVDCGRDSISPETGKQIIIENEDGTFAFTLGNLLIEGDSTAKTLTIDTNNDTKAKLFLDGNTPQIQIQQDTLKIIMNNTGIEVMAPSKTVKVSGTPGAPNGLGGFCGVPGGACLFSGAIITTDTLTGA